MWKVYFFTSTFTSSVPTFTFEVFTSTSTFSDLTLAPPDPIETEVLLTLSFVAETEVFVRLNFVEVASPAQEDTKNKTPKKMDSL